jgi:hypothetical protein
MGVDWIKLAQDGLQWRACLYTINKFWVFFLKIEGGPG